MYTVTGSPLQGTELTRLQSFLRSCDLDYDPAIQYSVVLKEEDEILATGSLDGATIKCVAVSPTHQGEDLTAQVLTLLMQRALENGCRHLMLYTKPRNQYLFQAFGFHPIIRTADCLLMENQRGGLNRFLDTLEKPSDERKPIGCIVANGNPFTLGHRYLVENAAKECAWVHLFILSEEKGMFSAAERLSMAMAGCSDLPNVLIHPTGPYLVSASTFPSYFIKDKQRVDDIHCELDLRLFGEKIAPFLGITRRYVGTEPNCAVTAGYNAAMKQLLPGYGIELREIQRRESDGQIISASRVRELIAQGKTDELMNLLPETTQNLINAR